MPLKHPTVKQKQAYNTLKTKMTSLIRVVKHNCKRVISINFPKRGNEKHVT